MHDHASKLVLFVVLLSIASFAISANTIPSLATQIGEDVKTDYENFGHVYLLQFLSFAAASMIGGKIAERFGLSSRFFVLWGLIGTGAVLALGAVLPNIHWFAVWIIPLGFFGGLIEVFSSIIITRMGKSDSSKLLCFSHIFFAFGAIFAPAVVAFLLENGFSWKTAFILLGALIVVVSVFFGLCSRVCAVANAAAGQTDEQRRSSVPLASDVLFALLALSMFLYVCVEGSIVVWVAPYFEKHLALTKPAAALRTSLYWGGIAAGRMLVMFLPRRWSLWPLLLAGAVGMLATCLMMSLKLSPAVASVLVVVCGLTAGPVWPVIVSCSQHVRQSPKFTAGVIGVGGLGGALGPWLLSYEIRALGWGWFFPILAVACVGQLIMIAGASGRAGREAKSGL